MAKFYRLNERITAPELRVIGADGQQIGVISKEEALQKAKEARLDLVEIAPNIAPPVAKIVDFKKFRYLESKKEQEAKKKARDVALKELWLSPRMADHDLQTRLRRVEEFVSNGDKVMLRVKFKGREMANPGLGHQILEKAFVILGDRVAVERDVKFEGRSLTVILGKSKGMKKDENQT